MVGYTGSNIDWPAKTIKAGSPASTEILRLKNCIILTRPLGKHYAQKLKPHKIQSLLRG